MTTHRSRRDPRPAPTTTAPCARRCLAAAEAELAETGIERFSLRSVAKRAGVSHAAPAHHFGDTGGLLTALAAEGFTRFLATQRAREAAGARRSSPDRSSPPASATSSSPSPTRRSSG